MKTQKQVGNSNATTPVEAIKKLLRDNPKGGEITLDDFNKLVPTFSRQECLTALRNEKDSGFFVTGRRGHASRWIYGEGAKDVAQKFQMRSIRLAAPKHNRTEQSANTDVQGNSFALRITIGGQVQTIPLQVELVGAQG